MEAILARAQIGVESGAPVPSFLPAFVIAFELIAEAHALGHGEAQRRVGDFYVGWEGRQPCRVACLVIKVIDDERFNGDGRW